MLEYLNYSYDLTRGDLVSALDELPLWSAPFGIKLLDKVKYQSGIKALDVGCGTGFPLLELAQRLGSLSKVYGVDPWEAAVKRVNLKKLEYGINNVEALVGVAEKLPFEKEYFNLVVSNNGLNNVQNFQLSLSEIYRVMKTEGQLVLTFNLQGTMMEFYENFEKVLQEEGLLESIQKMWGHIYEKRLPIKGFTEQLEKQKLRVRSVDKHAFFWKFSSGTSMFNHYAFRLIFIPEWRKIVPEDKQETVFSKVETLLNNKANLLGGLTLTVPYVVVDCRK